MRMLARAALLRPLVLIEILSLVIAIGGCSGGDSTSPPPGHEDTWNVVAGRTWTMPGMAEGYRCFGMHVTSDEYLTGFRLANASPVQNETLLTVLGTAVQEGPFECDAGTLGTHLIYAASVGTTPIEFPTSFGVHVSAGQYLLLNIHLVNPADTSVSDSTRIEARIGSATDVATPIDMTMGGTFQINIPNDGQVHTATGSCRAGADKHALAILPFMRSRGVHQTVTVVADSTSQTIVDQGFDWRHNTYTQFSTPIQVRLSSRVITTCSYINSGSQTETYGESSANESCFSAMYRYPISDSGNFYSCAEGGGSFDFTRE
jgi:hypothetical protein